MTAEVIETRPFGDTGERVTTLGLGGAGLPRHSFGEGVATVRRALELGITYLDTSPMYGDGLSQAIYGEALQGRSERYLLATKLGHFARPWCFRSPDALGAQLEENLRILRRDSVDVLQVHESDWHSWWSDDKADNRRFELERGYDFASAPVMRVLEEARKDGLCRFIGVTGNSAEHVGRVLRNVEVEVCLPAFHYDPLFRGTRHHVMPVAAEKGVAVVLDGVFQNGRLTDVPAEWLTDPPDWIPPELRPCLERLYALLKEAGLTLVALTLRYLMADAGVSNILVGAATPTEIEQAVAAVQAGPLPPDLHRAVEQLETG